MFLTSAAESFLAEMKAKALSRQRFFRLQEISVRQIDDDSVLGRAILDDASDEDLIRLGKNCVLELNTEADWKFIPGLLTDSEVAGHEIVNIGPFEFCMPVSMLKALDDHYLDSDGSQLILRKKLGGTSKS